MPTILSNSNINLHIDLPREGYKFSRFDWTGKITKVEFQNIELCSSENANHNIDIDGQGFYNEFGIDMPVGFEETTVEGWFHKIGIGQLQKDGNQYDFLKSYNIQPNVFNNSTSHTKLEITTASKNVNGFCYRLLKTIEVIESGFIISYRLHNTGEKSIITNEYNHNFISFNSDKLGPQYILKFPFDLIPETFEESVNPENKIQVLKSEFQFKETPSQPFFFSKLSAKKLDCPSWELINSNCKVGIRESVNIESSKINLWGWGHVISPEIYVDINLLPGQEMNWSRNYHIYEL